MKTGSFLLAAVCALLLSTGCAKQVTLAVHLVTGACVDATTNPTAQQPPSPTQGVLTLRFVVSLDAGVSPAPVDVPVGQNRVTLPLIPFDQPARVDVLGLSSSSGSQAALAFGSSGDFVIPSSQSGNTVDLTITLRRTDSFSESPVAAAPATCAVMARPRAYHGQTVLPNGQVMIYGGLQFPHTVDWSLVLGMPAQLQPGTAYLDDIEIFDPLTGTFIDAGVLDGTKVTADAVPVTRAFASLVASQSVDGGALFLGGEVVADGGYLVGADNGGYFSPGNGWFPRALKPHGHGCVAADSQGHVIAAGGLDATAVATPLGDFIDPAAWPPADKLIVPASDGGITQARVDQACSGLLGLLGNTGPLVAEAGGYTTDGTGQNVTLLGDLYFYGFASGTFAPFFVGSGTLVVEPLTAGARTRAKAVAYSTVDQLTQKPSDAMLIVGGLSCDTGAGDAGCAPTFADGGTAGQLGAPLANYFPRTMLQTELLGFPQVPNGSGTVAQIGVVAGPDLTSPRVDHCAVTLPDGRALILGGLGPYPDGGFGTLSEAVYTQPVAGVSSGKVVVPHLQPTLAPLEIGRAGMACSVLHDGSVLVTGGYATSGSLMGDAGTQQTVTMLRSAEVYTPLPMLVTAPAGP